VTEYLLDRRYVLTDRIAAGGMGEVWRGVDKVLNRPVAIKLLAAEHAADPNFKARFRAEARYAASLSHPGIARVWDYGEASDLGRAYLIMELVEGEPLSAILDREHRLSPAATVDIIGQCAAALQVAHQAGIVHRDMKPGNILVKPDGTAKITDFGIATAVRASQASHLTQTGIVMGTAMYVSPEQATGAAVTASSDIYSLGIVAYECLAGSPPFTGDQPLAIAISHKHDPVPELPEDVPDAVCDLVYTMLEKRSEDRPVTAQHVADRCAVLRDALALGGGATERLSTSGGWSSTGDDEHGTAAIPLAEGGDYGGGDYPGDGDYLEDDDYPGRRRWTQLLTSRRGVAAATTVAVFGGGVIAAVLLTSNNPVAMTSKLATRPSASPSHSRVSPTPVKSPSSAPASNVVTEPANTQQAVNQPSSADSTTSAASHATTAPATQSATPSASPTATQSTSPAPSTSASQGAAANSSAAASKQ
jgi:eukaryotic-like serine/threonine-protein kinase